MAEARHSDDTEFQEDIDYENETTITARRSEAEGHYESLDLQKIDNAVYGDLQPGKVNKNQKRCLFKKEKQIAYRQNKLVNS